jgi:hypothetical protein
VGLIRYEPTIERLVISKIECLKIVRWSIRNATICVEQSVQAKDLCAKEWFAKGATCWRDIAACWLKVCEIDQEREGTAYSRGDHAKGAGEPAAAVRPLRKRRSNRASNAPNRGPFAAQRLTPHEAPIRH